MDRDKAREGLAQITDEAARIAETSRIEGVYHLDLAVTHMLTKRENGTYPKKEVVARIVDSIQHMVYD